MLVARQDGDTYWLAKALRPPYQTTADQNLGLGSAIVPKSTWVVEVQWYDLDVDSSLTDSQHVYRGSHVNQFPLIVRSLISVTKDVSFEAVNGAGKGMYVLSRETHNRIMKYGNWEHGWGDRE